VVFTTLMPLRSLKTFVLLILFSKSPNFAAIDPALNLKEVKSLVLYQSGPKK